MQFENKLKEILNENVSNGNVWIYGPLIRTSEFVQSTKKLKKDFIDAGKKYNVNVKFKPARPLEDLKGKEKTTINNAIDFTDTDVAEVESNYDVPEIYLKGTRDNIILAIIDAFGLPDAVAVDGMITSVDNGTSQELADGLDKLENYIPDIYEYI